MSPERWTRRTPPRASPVAASPRCYAAAPGGIPGQSRGGRAAAEVRRLRGGGGQMGSQTPELSQPWDLCRGGDSMTSCLVPSHSDEAKWRRTFVQVDSFMFAWNDVAGRDISDKYDLMSCLFCCLGTSDESAKAGLSGQISLTFLTPSLSALQWHSTMKDDGSISMDQAKGPEDVV